MEEIRREVVGSIVMDMSDHEAAYDHQADIFVQWIAGEKTETVTVECECGWKNKGVWLAGTAEKGDPEDQPHLYEWEQHVYAHVFPQVDWDI